MKTVKQIVSNYQRVAGVLACWKDQRKICFALALPISPGDIDVQLATLSVDELLHSVEIWQDESRVVCLQ